MEHHVTIPCQDIRLQPPERIRWEEATRTNQNDIQERTQTTWISNIEIWLKTEMNRSILIPCVMIPPQRQQRILVPQDTTSRQQHHAQTNRQKPSRYQSRCRMDRSSHRPTSHYPPNTTFQTRHAKRTYFQACKNPSYQSAHCVKTTVSLSSMKKGSQSMTN